MIVSKLIQHFEQQMVMGRHNEPALMPVINQASNAPFLNPPPTDTSSRRLAKSIIRFCCDSGLLLSSVHHFDGVLRNSSVPTLAADGQVYFSFRRSANPPYITNANGLKLCNMIKTHLGDRVVIPIIYV